MIRPSIPMNSLDPVGMGELTLLGFFQVLGTVLLGAVILQRDHAHKRLSKGPHL